tara:strand:+ start:6771 stop:7811 length:1041 start_codon:yes stop_codon:yes gene_type:complete
MTAAIALTDTQDAAADAIRRAVELLQAGEVVALPTETVYGLGADALNEDAVAKVFAVKERPEFDPLIVHLSDREQLREVAEIPEEIESYIQQLVQEFWPGPLTIVLPKKAAIPDLVTAGMPTVAVRMSAHPIFTKVARTLGRPIAAPSANRFGRISPTSAAAVMEELGDRIPLILDGGACSDGLESTIVRVSPPEKNKPVYEILRAGPVTPDMLKQFGQIKKRKPGNVAKDAPGQLASHYAPRTPIRLLEKPSDFVADPAKSYALLSYRENPKDGYLDLHEWDEVAALTPGSGKQAEAAVRFFYVLRQLDHAGVDEIIAEPMSEVGLGIAMMDRLRRASHQDEAGS